MYATASELSISREEMGFSINYRDGFPAFNDYKAK